ncbi:MAG: hypothetical protein HS116_16600 [Planctomycetes bacterium]|nr:hypothetical protein [Planctomycetota bacterium]
MISPDEPPPEPLGLSAAEHLRLAFAEWQTNPDFSEALVTLADQTRLAFLHRGTERKAFALGPLGAERERGSAHSILNTIKLFRLNAKHLDIDFADGSRYELKPGEVPPRT